ncbi:Sugar-specific transcriptional regulator TrmB [Marinomonas gallaica]|uniref:Sugar-specific transcriptional regulator TrmB n=1 Tax=Marinomonas gallaica TaxID=1806667 RepID=A0A1C3JRH7_9GAMM|nr:MULTISPECIES: helix-turn-helix domain-containing protein [Marinomonas]MCO4786474.1 TrmB family transcriptional regulator [Marinomonas atlantica]SBT17831.1 Sugar-specific transcriptional regulator TrmB [Marinomonas gallaica]SBT20157.1 Sugar-specific transcriptional regulator TrmB [Marinomonas gallaica]
MLHQVLEQLGLTEREATLYQTLLKLGPASIRDIAEQSGVNRGSAYESLKQLQNKGVVSYFPKGKRRFFMAENPDILLNLAEERKQNIEKTIDSLKHTIIPSLVQSQPTFHHTDVRYYEGDDGIEWVLRDILNVVSQQDHKEYCVFSSKPIRPYLYRPFPTYTKQRVKLGINVKVIALGDGGEEAELSERKWIKTEGSVDASYIAIYPPKCAIISLARDNFPSAVVLESNDIAKAQQIIFDTLWRLL